MNVSYCRQDRSFHEPIAVVSEIHRITVDPEQCGGRPCLRGLRVRVKDILDLLAAGASRDEILEDYPNLEARDITAALEYAAKRMSFSELLMTTRLRIPARPTFDVTARTGCRYLDRLPRVPCLCPDARCRFPPTSETSWVEAYIGRPQA